MNLLNKIRYRFSSSTFEKISIYKKMVKSSNLSLRNHVNDYYKEFILSLFFGRFYKSLTLYGLKRKKKENDFFYSSSSGHYLRIIYESKNTSLLLSGINESVVPNVFEIFGLKFELSEVENFQEIFIWDLKDLIIPYIFNGHIFYNNSLLGEGTYESENVFVKEGDVVMDVGANIGVFSIYSILKRQAKLVYAFEPVKSSFEINERNFKLNGVFNKVYSINKGLGNSEGVFDLFISSNNIGANSLVFNQDGNKTESVSITTLDNFVETKSIQQLDFIKVDIEGAERLFLEGALNTLAKFKPKLSICTYHRIDDPVVLTSLILRANPNYKIEYYSRKLYAY